MRQIVIVSKDGRSFLAEANDNDTNQQIVDKIRKEACIPLKGIYETIELSTGGTAYPLWEEEHE